MSSAFQQGSPERTQCLTDTVILLLALTSLPYALLCGADMALPFLVADPLGSISCGGSLKLLNKVLLQEEQGED